MINHKVLLLVCKTESHGQYLALLLSNHLRLFDSEAQRVFTPHKNAFSNHQIHLFYQKKCNEVTLQQWKLLVDEGLDTGNLFGCLVNSDHLNLFSNSIHFSSLRWIFLPESDSEIQQQTSFCIKNSIKDFLLLSPALLSVVPHTVLKHLSTWLQLPIVRSEDIEPNVLWPLKQVPVFPEFIRQSIQIQQQQPIRILSSLTCNEAINRIREANQRIRCFGLHDIQWLLSSSNELFETLQKEVPEFLNIHRMHNLQETLSRFPIDCIVIYLDLNFEIPAKYWEPLVLNPHNHCILTGSIGTNPENYLFEWKDLLASIRMAGAWRFNLADYREIAGLDTNLPATIQWTDLMIRILSQKENHLGYSFPVQVLPDKKIETTSLSDYQNLIQKHRHLIEKHVEEILHEIGAQHVDQDLMLQKLHKLNQMLAHSQDELSTVKHFSIQLQQRIVQLEHSRYIRLKKAIGKYKKLFFRKKTPGHSPIKRLLSFLRFMLSKSGAGILRKGAKKITKTIYLKLEDRPVRIVYADEDDGKPVFTYDQWIKTKLSRSIDHQAYINLNKDSNFRPLLSIIMPVYNTPVKYLKEAIESVLNQGYSNWELCIADDHSSEPKVLQLLRAYRVRDSRIKIHYRNQNGHISKTSNDALTLAQGDYVVLMDHDDLLAGNALQEIVLALQQHPQADLLYSDEDKIDDLGIHSAPHFKPDWCPDHLLSRNYIGHVAVIRRSLVEESGGFRIGFEGSQDYDLLLRITELTDRIVHIPKILYHWRIHQQSTAHGEDVKPYAYMAAKKALEEACLRRGMKVQVKYLQGLRGYKIEYPLPYQPLVSIVIPSKDQHELLKNTIDSLVKKTRYSSYEIVLLNNNSKSQAFFNLIEEYKNELGEKFRCIDCNIPFNFSRLMNIGRNNSQGEVLLFLNNDVEIIHGDWLEEMVCMALQKRIGAVGVKLLYPDDTIQHAGVIIGLGGVAGHAFTGIHKDEPGYFNYIQSTNNFSALTAACLMLRTEVYDAVNGMDEQFEVEYNDVDLCLKIREKGYHNVYLPHVELYHFESATRGHPHQSKSGYERHLKEMELFKQKWPEYIKNDPCYNPNLNLGVHDFSMNFHA